MNKEITAVEQGLRYRVQIKGKPDKKMVLLDRMKHYKIPGVSVAVINNGAIEWAMGYGTLAIDSKELVTPKHLFQVASISKLVAAVGALKLVQEGKLSLDLNVNDYLKSWKIPENEFTKIEKVTLRRLLSHSAGTTVSGFPGYTVGQTIPSALQVLDGIQPPANTEAVRVIMIPGEKFQYSGGGSTIVQQLIEDVTDTPFSIWMKENIFSPLEMNSSTFEQPLPMQTVPLAAHGHLPNGNKVPNNWHIYPEMAAAGLWSTASDLARLVIAIHLIFNGDHKGILPPDLVKEMLTTQTNISGECYSGLGVILRKNDGNFIFEHGGLNSGFCGLLDMLPLQGQGMVILTNGDANAFYFIEELKNSIADVYQWPKMEAAQRTETYLDSARYKQYLGKYYLADAPDEVLEIYSDEDKLYLKVGLDMPALQLYAEAEDQCFTKEENQTIYFTQNNNDSELRIHFDDDQIFGQTFLYHKKIKGNV